VIEVAGIDRDGEPRSLTAEAASVGSLASAILDSGWKYARLTCCGELVAEVALCPCNGGPPVRQVLTYE
jgi:hypothetical protein